MDRPMMGPHRPVNPPELAAAVGFSHAVVPVAGTTVHLGGQVAFDTDGRIVGTTLAEQYGQALRNVVTALRAAGGAPEHLVSLVVYVTDVPAYREDLVGIGRAHRQAVGKHFPAMALVGVTDLVAPNAMVEIVATAVIPT